MKAVAPVIHLSPRHPEEGAVQLIAGSRHSTGGKEQKDRWKDICIRLGTNTLELPLGLVKSWNSNVGGTLKGNLVEGGRKKLGFRGLWVRNLTPAREDGGFGWEATVSAFGTTWRGCDDGRQTARTAKHADASGRIWDRASDALALHPTAPINTYPVSARVSTRTVSTNWLSGIWPRNGLQHVPKPRYAIIRPISLATEHNGWNAPRLRSAAIL